MTSIFRKIKIQTVYGFFPNANRQPSLDINLCKTKSNFYSSISFDQETPKRLDAKYLK